MTGGGPVMEGARLPGRGPPFIGPLPFIMGPDPGGPRGMGAEESLGGGGRFPLEGEETGAVAGRVRLTMLR
jgi:hypothetical protein